MPVPRLLAFVLTVLLGLGAGYLAGEAISGLTLDPARAALNTFSLMLAGLLLGLLLLPRAERLLTLLGGWGARRASSLVPERVTAATVGLVVALLLSVLISNLLGGIPAYRWWWNVAITLALAGFFIPFALRNSDVFGPFAGGALRRRRGSKILDSNVIIDGRVTELARAGFLEGELTVPTFVLRELQLLSDHADPARRTRGKRGLGVLEELRASVPLRVDDWDTTELPLTDDKLVRLARLTGGKLVTNDNNLAQVARLHGVSVLSLNAAAVALRPQLQAGESLNVTITKKGQQAGQGVGYLEDGTMLVVEGGAAHNNKSVRVVVVNSVQTAVGRMVFARATPEAEE